MIISCKNGKAHADIGSHDTWKALSSTIQVRLNTLQEQIPHAMELLTGGICLNSHCLEAAHQFNIIRDELSKYPPDQMVFDADDLSKKAPWGDNISPVITSCSNYFTTADGRDLLAEIVRLLCIAAYTKADVEVR